MGGATTEMRGGNGEDGGGGGAGGAGGAGSAGGGGAGGGSPGASHEDENSFWQRKVRELRRQVNDRDDRIVELETEVNSMGDNVKN
jgi:hypothetical protein